jgi:hypothetical protein
MVVHLFLRSESRRDHPAGFFIQTAKYKRLVYDAGPTGLAMCARR